MGGWRKRAEQVEKLSLHSLRALSKSLVQRVLVDVVDGGPRRVVEVRRGRIWGHLRASPHTGVSVSVRGLRCGGSCRVPSRGLRFRFRSCCVRAEGST
jgi:hypothetical protein